MDPNKETPAKDSIANTSMDEEKLLENVVSVSFASSAGIMSVLTSAVDDIEQYLVSNDIFIDCNPINIILGKARAKAIPAVERFGKERMSDAHDEFMPLRKLFEPSNDLVVEAMEEVIEARKAADILGAPVQTLSSNVQCLSEQLKESNATIVDTSALLSCDPSMIVNEVQKLLDKVACKNQELTKLKDTVKSLNDLRVKNEATWKLEKAKLEQEILDAKRFVNVSNVYGFSEAVTSANDLIEGDLTGSSLTTLQEVVSSSLRSKKEVARAVTTRSQSIGQILETPAPQNRGEDRTDALVELVKTMTKMQCLPPLKPYDGSTRFDDFLCDFELRFPKGGNFSDSERRTFLAQHLEGDVATYYNTLPDKLRASTFNKLVEAIRTRNETSGKRSEALTKFRLLMKDEKESVASFCNRLEQIGKVAFGKECDFYLAEKLCVSLVDWPDSNALYGALEQQDEAGLVYDSVKLMALRLEQTHLARAERLREMEADEQRQQPFRPHQFANKYNLKCFNCNGVGHSTAACRNSGQLQQQSRRNADTNGNWGGGARHVNGITNVKKDPPHRQVSKSSFDFSSFVVNDCPPVAEEVICKPSTIVYANVLGCRVKLLPDSGAEVSIMPTALLDRIRKKSGLEMIRDCVTMYKTPATMDRIIDASRNEMAFEVLIKVKVSVVNGKSAEVFIFVHESESDTLIIGNNAAEVLGFKFSKENLTALVECEKGEGLHELPSVHLRSVSRLTTVNVMEEGTNVKKGSPIGNNNTSRGRRGFDGREGAVVQHSYVSKENRRCFNCGKVGHEQKDCSVVRKTSDQRVCFGCGRKGHLKAMCRIGFRSTGQVLNHLVSCVQQMMDMTTRLLDRLAETKLCTEDDGRQRSSFQLQHSRRPQEDRHACQDRQSPSQRH